MVGWNARRRVVVVGFAVFENWRRSVFEGVLRVTVTLPTTIDSPERSMNDLSVSGIRITPERRLCWVL